MICAGILLVIIVIIVIFLVCREKNHYEIRLEAHRGWSQMYPENTLTAFEEAGKCEAFEAIETDVQETVDGMLVLMHDRELDRMTNASGCVKDYTFKQIREMKIDGGNGVEEYPNEKIPTIEEYLDICKKYGKIPYIEMKALTEKGVKKLIETLDESGWKGKCVLTTFQYKNIERVRAITLDYPVQYMVKDDFEMEEILPALLKYENMTLRISAYVITEEIVESCRENDVPIECYGLKQGDKNQYRRLQELGVQGVTCNDWKNLR